MNASKHDQSSAARIMKALTVQDFLNFGLGHIAYVRQQDMGDGVIWAVYAADGTPLASHETAEEAVSAVRYEDLKPVRVH
jgi:hypothetical protein